MGDKQKDLKSILGEGVAVTSAMLNSTGNLLVNGIPFTTGHLMGERYNRPGLSIINECHTESNIVPSLICPSDKDNRNIIYDAAALCHNVYYYCSPSQTANYYHTRSFIQENGWYALPLGGNSTNLINRIANFKLSGAVKKFYDQLLNSELSNKLVGNSNGLDSMIFYQSLDGTNNRFRVAHVSEGTMFKKGSRLSDLFADITQGSSFNGINSNNPKVMEFNERLKDILNAQYNMSLKNAAILDSIVRNMSTSISELYFMGHSLGGGLAHINALSTKRPSVTFNPASVSPDNISKYESAYRELTSKQMMPSIYMEGEILSLCYSNLLGLPKTGNRYKISNTEGGNPVTRHYMAQICSSYGLKPSSEVIFLMI